MIFLIKILIQEQHINSYPTRVTLSLFYILKQVKSVNDSILGQKFRSVQAKVIQAKGKVYLI